MLLFYKYIFAQGAYTLILISATYYFSRYLTEFFEGRPVPAVWTFFFLGITFYLASTSLLFIPFLSGAVPVRNYWILYSALQPAGAIVAAYCIYKLEGESRQI